MSSFPVSSRQMNPFKPGAGHSPPHLAGRIAEAEAFSTLLDQDDVTQNLVLTGLRGVGKTVLMDGIYKPLAGKKDWVWVGSDFSESAFVSEYALCQRLLTDLSLFTSQITLNRPSSGALFHQGNVESTHLSYAYLTQYFDCQPGLTADKLKATLRYVWEAVKLTGKRGVVFAYDESQVVQDRRDKDQYPLALLLETFQSLQRHGMRYLLLLTGLPTLFPKLVESRTYAERMFVVQDIGRLDTESCREAITKPLDNNAIKFPANAVDTITKESQCYPYFVQFIAREAYDYFKANVEKKPNQSSTELPIGTLILKLDTDFFSGRWHRATDRQRELLLSIACLSNAGDEFTVAEIVEGSKSASKKFGTKPFKTNDVSQQLPRLADSGLIYKNRYGKYCLAVPLFDAYILRQYAKSKNASLFDGIE